MIPAETIERWRSFLEARYAVYAVPGFVANDPVSIPHQFAKKDDIEIAAFFTATISWGNRKAILKAASQLMERMDGAPADFLLKGSDEDWKKLDGFVYRTFQFTDLLFFSNALKNIYSFQGGLEKVFTDGFNAASSYGIVDSIAFFRKVFFSSSWLPQRTVKHVPDVLQGSAAKRINMFLRWMVRPSAEGIDFGIWNAIPPSSLLCPLDLHSAAIAREAGLLKRHVNDLIAVIELTNNLRLVDSIDPVRFDLALFGEGVNR